jgi:hypothetical protein
MKDVLEHFCFHELSLSLNICMLKVILHSARIKTNTIQSKINAIQFFQPDLKRN